MAERIPPRRTAASAPAPTRGAPARTAAPRSAFFRGAAGMQQTDVEIAHAKQKAEERKAAGSNPFRFRVGIGETKSIIIVDDKPDFFMYEHALKDSEGNWGKLFTGCVKTFDACPVCEAQGKESYYAMVLTCIDLSPFSLRDGTRVDFSRKLLIVKPAQQKKFLRFFAKEGTLRGALFEMTRDGDKDSSIGNDIEFIEFVEEDELATYTRSWKDREGKQHHENCDEPYDYERLFEEPTTEKLRAIAGGRPAPGSREANDRELGGGSRPARPTTRTTGGRAAAKDDDWDKDDDSAPFDADPPKERAAPARRGAAEAAPARRGRAVPEETADEDDAPEEAPAPRRGRVAPVDAPPAVAPRRGRTVAPAEDDEDDDAADEAPPPRAARRR